MNFKNKKINSFLFRKVSSKKGIALLFAIMLSTIFFTIALGVLNISVKELNFSTSAKDTGNAFFAADSGVECALYNDKSGSDTFTGENISTATINCFSNEIKLNSSKDDTSQSFIFNITGLGSNGVSCAKVTVVKKFDISVDPLVPSVVTSTKITSKGYNIGGDNENCDSKNTNRVERVLEVNY